MAGFYVGIKSYAIIKQKMKCKKKSRARKKKRVIINKSYGMFQWHHIQVFLFKVPDT